MSLPAPLILDLPQETVLTGGKIIDAVNNNIYSGDVVIRDGFITYIGLQPEYSSQAKVIDVSGKYISPGFFDMHVHFREPGNETAEDLFSGANAAMAGGFTGVGMMPNTSPAIDNTALLLELEARVKDHLVEVHAIPSVTSLRAGDSLSDMDSLVKAGALAFTDDGSGLQKGEVMKMAMCNAARLHKPILVHAEDESFTTGVINESSVSRDLNLPGISNLSESVMIARDILISETFNAPVHFQHISTREGVELVRKAKKAGLKVTCETAPHYFSLTDEKTRSLSPDFKMKPPLRTEMDRLAVIKGLEDGTIDAIATDHAPHRKEAKDLGILKAPFGVTGLESAFSVSLKYLVEPGHLSLSQLISKLAVGARKILGLDFDLLKTGKAANITVLDLNISGQFDSAKCFSKSTNSPFKGEVLPGGIHTVINKYRYWENNIS